MQLSILFFFKKQTHQSVPVVSEHCQPWRSPFSDNVPHKVTNFLAQLYWKNSEFFLAQNHTLGEI